MLIPQSPASEFDFSHSPTRIIFAEFFPFQQTQITGEQDIKIQRLNCFHRPIDGRFLAVFVSIST